MKNRMMVFADFYHDSTGWNGKDFSGPVELIRLTGCDSIFHLDGRKTLENQKRDAETRLKTLNASLNLRIKGYQIMRGIRYTTAKHLTDIIKTPAWNEGDNLMVRRNIGNIGLQWIPATYIQPIGTKHQLRLLGGDYIEIVTVTTESIGEPKTPA